MTAPRLLSVREAVTKPILQIAKVTVGLSSYIGMHTSVLI